MSALAKLFKNNTKYDKALQDVKNVIQNQFQQFVDLGYIFKYDLSSPYEFMDNFYDDGTRAWIIFGLNLSLIHPKFGEIRGVIWNGLFTSLSFCDDGFPVSWEVEEQYTSKIKSIEHFENKMNKITRKDKNVYSFERRNSIWTKEEYLILLMDPQKNEKLWEETSWPR